MADDWGAWDDELDEGMGDMGDEADVAVDPLDQLNKHEMNLFFRILDLIPDDKREAAMAYLMDNPRIIRAVVDNAKQKRELIKENDVEGIKALLAEEQVALDKIDAMAAEGEDFYYNV